MGEAFIVRRGGKKVDITAAPSINFVSKTFDSITFTITNNDTETVDIFWEIGDSTPDANILSLASGETSSNQVISGLTEETEYTIFAFANAANKAGSQTTSQVRTTPEEPIVYTEATGGTTLEYNSGGKRYRSHTFTSNGTFTVTTVGNILGGGDKVDYLIIAGGGAGGRKSFNSNQYGGGGGGAGGYRTTISPAPSNDVNSKITVTTASYGVTIGAGGVGGNPGTNGTNSSVFGRISIGGGRGGRGGATNTQSQVGGSGGAGARSDIALERIPANGTSGQGFGGQNGTFNTTGITRGGGAGGAGGANPNGLNNNLRTGLNENRGIGGREDQEVGDENTGNGGGGRTLHPGTGNGGNGGSGIVIIRYEIAPN